MLFLKQYYFIGVLLLVHSIPGEKYTLDTLDDTDSSILLPITCDYLENPQSECGEHILIPENAIQNRTGFWTKCSSGVECVFAFYRIPFKLAASKITIDAYHHGESNVKVTANTNSGNENHTFRSTDSWQKHVIDDRLFPNLKSYNYIKLSISFSTNQSELQFVVIDKIEIELIDFPTTSAITSITTEEITSPTSPWTTDITTEEITSSSPSWSTDITTEEPTSTIQTTPSSETTTTFSTTTSNTPTTTSTQIPSTSKTTTQGSSSSTGSTILTTTSLPPWSTSSTTQISPPGESFWRFSNPGFIALLFFLIAFAISCCIIWYICIERRKRKRRKNSEGNVNIIVNPFVSGNNGSGGGLEIYTRAKNISSVYSYGTGDYLPRLQRTENR